MCPEPAVNYHETIDKRLCKQHLSDLDSDESKQYKRIENLWTRLSSELIAVEQDILVMQERLGFITTNKHIIRLTAQSNEVVETCKATIEKNISKVLQISQEMLKETSLESISNDLESIRNNIQDIFKEVMFSTYPHHRKTVCCTLEKAVNNAGIRSNEEFKYTGDEPISPEVYGKDYEFCTMAVQFTSSITKLQEDTKGKNKKQKQKEQDFDNLSELPKAQIEEILSKINDIKAMRMPMEEKYALFHDNLKEHCNDSETYDEESLLELDYNKVKFMAFVQSYARHSIPLPPLGRLCIWNVPGEDPSLAAFLRHSVPHAQLKGFGLYKVRKRTAGGIPGGRGGSCTLCL